MQAIFQRSFMDGKRLYELELPTRQKTSLSKRGKRTGADIQARLVTLNTDAVINSVDSKASWCGVHSVRCLTRWKKRSISQVRLEVDSEALDSRPTRREVRARI